MTCERHWIKQNDADEYTSLSITYSSKNINTCACGLLFNNAAVGTALALKTLLYPFSYCKKENDYEYEYISVYFVPRKKGRRPRVVFLPPIPSFLYYRF